ncbi:MAG: archease [Promethearchaeota archaeon]|nr:MAG: archease [Candidatus Lokiarchaeota archaeon]
MMKYSQDESGFEFLEHTADVKVKCWGKSPEDAFSQAAYGLMATITPDLNLIEKKIHKTLEIEAEDKEALLYDFLSEFLFLFDVERLVFGEINVRSIKQKKGDFFLTAALVGEEFKREKHELGTEVKAITYSYMKIEEKEDFVIIEIVFDI